MGQFHQLNNEILIQIFDYLSFSELFQCFFNLQAHLNRLIENYFQTFRFNKKNYVQNYVILSQLNCNDDLIKSYLTKLPSLRLIHLRKIHLITLNSLIEQYPMQQLQLITIEPLLWHYYPKEFYHQSWSRIVQSFNTNLLHSLHLPFSIHYYSLNDFSSTFLTLKSMTLQYISVNQMLSWMSHTPNLSRFKAYLTNPKTHLSRSSLILSRLNHLSIQLEEQYSLDELNTLLYRFPALKYFHLKLAGEQQNEFLFQPLTWQRIVEDQFPQLMIFQLQLIHICSSSFSDLKNHGFQRRFDQDLYFRQRKPYFHVNVTNVYRQSFSS